MARTSPAQTNFNAGELSPLFSGRVDMAKYGNGCNAMRNFIPLPQGPARRRPGTRFVAPTKTAAARSWLVPFVFSEDDAFQLEFGDSNIRFYTDNGQLLTGAVTPWSNLTNYVVGDLASNGGVTYYCVLAHINQVPPNVTYWYALTGSVYEIPSPYTAAQLEANNGTFRLSYAQTGDVLFTTHRSHFPKKITRLGNTNWTIANAAITGGPFIGVNPDETVTVYASAATGTVTLTASSSIFTAEKVGTLFLLEEKAINTTKAWEPAKAVVIGDERRSDSNTYRALTAGTTGSVKPVHREGARFDGDVGVQWQYVHSGYGIARITAVGGTTATATVVSEIPSNAVLVGNASLRWSFSAWDSVLGYPDLVTFFRERLIYIRGATVWGSVAGDLENFSSRDGAETLADSAFTVEIASGQINDAVWVQPADALLIGTKGAEFSLSEVSGSEVFGPGNIQVRQESAYGSRQVHPARVGDSVIFVLPTGRRVRDMRFSFNTNGYEANDVTIIADHIAAGQVVQMAFAQEPHSIVWSCCADGSLIALTYLLEQDVIGWHPHPIGGDGIVESVSVIPAPSGTHDQVWMIVRRLINGAEARYVEYMEREWSQTDGDDIADALYSDSGASFDGTVDGVNVTLTGGTSWSAGDVGQLNSGTFTPGIGEVGEWVVISLGSSKAIVEITGPWFFASTPVQFVSAVPVELRNVLLTGVAYARDNINGLAHLEGETVDVTVDGGAHPQVVVTAGAITLQERAVKAQIGLPAPCELETMRIEAGAMDGTAQGKVKRIHRVVFRLYETLGGKAGPSGKEEDILYRSSSNPMNNPPPVFTGAYYLLYPEGYNTEGRVRFVNAQPFPTTVVAIYPQLVTEDRS